MIHVQFRAGLSARILCYALCLFLAPCFASCSNNNKEAETAIQEYLKTHGATDVKEVKIELFHTNKQVPDKAYAGVVTTYTFGSGSGELQREPSGYILKREGGHWVVEGNTKYTKDEQMASEILLGKRKIVE
jgi:hypothetical protein